MLSHNSQQQSLTSNENRPLLQRNREPYNNFRRGINNGTRTLTTPSPTMTHPTMANIFHLFLHSIPKISYTHIIISQTTLIKQFKLEDMHITLHHSE